MPGDLYSSRHSTRAAFLNQFDADLVQWVMEFASIISDLDHDVLIFTARKSACLYDAMRRVGAVAAKGQVVSDRVLDMDLRWLEGKSIALIDDVIITGSSLYRARTTLERAGAARVDTFALAIDVDNWVADLVEPEGQSLRLPSQRAINLCTQIVNALAVVPRPYNLDWPLIEGVGLRRPSAHVISTLANWSTFETTNTVQGSAGIASRSHEPRDALLRRFCQETGLTRSVLALTKIRTYTRIADHDPNRVISTVVPIVAFEGLSVDEVDDMFGALVAQLGGRVAPAFRTPESRLRLIQFSAASRLGNMWLDDLESSTHTSEGESLAQNQITMAFSPQAADFARQTALRQAPPPQFALRPRIVLGDSNTTPSPADAERAPVAPPNYESGSFTAANAPGGMSQGDLDEDHRRPSTLSAQAGAQTGPRAADGEAAEPVAQRALSADEILVMLTEPFLALYTTRELPARAILKEYGRAAFDEPRYRETIDRLNSGQSRTHLVQAVREASGGQNVDADRAVSAFLDIAVDHGVAVPIMQFKDGVVQRTYRHGEDIVYTRNEARLFSLMLRGAAQAGGRALTDPSSSGSGHSLSKIQVEKLCVIFTRIGLQLGFFTRWSGRLGAGETLGTRWHLKGALMQKNSSIIFGANLGNGLTDELTRLEVLRPRGKNKGYEFGRAVQHASTSAHSDFSAEGIGSLLGALTSNQAGEGRLTDNDLTLLASCLDLPSLIGALTAELSITAHNWRTFTHRIETHDLGEDRCRDLSKSLVEDDIWEALNSGYYKFTRYSSGRIREILDRVAVSLASDPWRENTWRSYWPEHVGDEHIVAPDLSAHANELGRWITSMATYVYLLRFALDVGAGHRRRAHSEGLLKKADTMAEEHRRAANKGAETSLIRFVREVKADFGAGKLDTRVAVERCRSAIDEHVRHADRLIDKTKACANPFGEVPSIVSFDCALIIYTRVKEDRSDLELLVSQTVAERRKSAEGRPVRLETARLTNDVDEPFTIVGRGARAYAYLNNIAERISSRADPRFGVRAVLIPELVDHEQVHTQAPLPGNYYGSGFESLRDDLARSPGLLDGTGGQIIHVSRPGHARSDERVQAAATHTHSDPDIHVIDDRSDQNPNSRRAMRSLFVTTHTSPAAQTHRADIGVVTIIREEASAVREWLSDHGSDRQRHGPSIVHSASIGVDGTELRVAHIQASGQGDSAALSAFHALAGAERPRLMVLLGIAGGIHKDAKLGDVVIGNQIINYGPYAATDTGPRHRGHAWMIPKPTVTAIQECLGGPQGDQVESSVAAQVLGRANFTMVEGPIGTGPAVVKFRDAEVRQWLQAFNEKTLALETEAEAPCRFFYERGDNGDIDSYLILRGISDHADEDKNDKWKEAAAKNAVCALRALLPAIAFMFPASDTREPSGEKTAND